MTSIFKEIILTIIVLIHYSCTVEIVDLEVNPDGSVTSQYNYPELPTRQQFEVVFENKSGHHAKLYWVNPTTNEYVEQADMLFPSLSTINTFPGHIFVFTLESSKSEILYRTEMSPYIDVVTLLPKERMQNINQVDKHAFYKDYYLKTGKRWKNYYPRNPLKYSFPTPIQNIGQIINRYSNHTKYHKINSEIETALISNNITFKEQLKQHKVSTQSDYARTLSLIEINHHEFELEQHFIMSYNYTEFYRKKTDIMGYELEVLCTKPIAVRIFDFLSDDECEHIISLGLHTDMLRSTVGETKLTNLARTSSHIWIHRDMSGIVDNIVNRIGDIVNINGSVLHSNLSSEDLQLVHYRQGEYYKQHYDYGTDSENNRYITMLMYLNDVEFGGNTSFPDAHEECKDNNGYFGVHPVKRSVVFFYNMLEDANVDVFSLHEAEPPFNGSHKWMTNLWIWDPYFHHQFSGYDNAVENLETS